MTIEEYMHNEETKMLFGVKKIKVRKINVRIVEAGDEIEAQHKN